MPAVPETTRIAGLSDVSVKFLREYPFSESVADIIEQDCGKHARLAVFRWWEQNCPEAKPGS